MNTMTHITADASSDQLFTETEDETTVWTLGRSKNGTGRREANSDSTNGLKDEMRRRSWNLLETLSPEQYRELTERIGLTDVHNVQNVHDLNDEKVSQNLVARRKEERDNIMALVEGCRERRMREAQRPDNHFEAGPRRWRLTERQRSVFEKEVRASA